MGAEVQLYNTKLPQEATKVQLENKFHELKDQALHEYGHRGYTGTIAEARGCEITERAYDDARSISRNVDDFAEKWGPAVAVFNRATKTWWFAGIFSS